MVALLPQIHRGFVVPRLNNFHETLHLSLEALLPSLSITFRFPSLSFFSALHPTTFVKKFPDTWPNFPLSPHNPSPKYGRVDMVASLTHSQLLQSCISICPFFFFLTQLNINIKLIAHININKLLV